MTSYAIAQIDEEDQVEVFAPKQAPKWRRVGVVAGVVCAIVAAAGVMARPRRLTPMRRMTNGIKSFMKGFSARKLKESEMFEASISGAFQELGGPTPDRMKIHAVMRKATAQYENLEMIITFAALEGKGEALAEQLGEVKKGFVQMFADFESDDEADELDDAVAIARQGDTVAATVTFPKYEAWDGEAEAKELVEDGFNQGTAPSFEATLSFGRTFEEMGQHLNESVFTLPRGVAYSFKTAFASKIISGLSEFMAYELSDDLGLGVLAAFASMSHEFTVTYRKEALANLTRGSAFKPIAEDLEILLRDLPGVPVAPMKGLQDVSKGVKSLEFRGLTDDYEVAMDFTRFNPAPMVADIVSDSKIGSDSDFIDDVIKMLG